MRNLLFSAVLALLAGPGAAQTADTLADIRQELQFVYGEILALKRELSTTGNVGLQGSRAPALERLDTLEAEMQRLTGLIEQKQFAIEAVVKDGTNRIGDLEFRLCELEPGCDVSSLDRAAPLGGQAVLRPGAGGAGAGQAGPDGGADGDTQGAAGATDSERASFKRAMSALEARDFTGAADQFAALVENFPGGPLTGEAQYWRGTALAGARDWRGAAQAFLDSFSGAPQGVKAPDALFRLGQSLNELGQKEEACLILSEVPVRYPNATVVSEATAEFTGLGCG